MVRRITSDSIRARATRGLGPVRHGHRPRFEALEERTMLDGAFGSTTPAVVVGRTLSSSTVSGLQGHAETITYTVYNEQADPETGVLLTTTLRPGVTFASASALPDQSGQDLAWSLGTIQGYGRASVSVTVALATPSPLQLDGGAKAYAFLDGGIVGNITTPATLSTLTIPAGTLDSTPDANTTDPFIQEEAAKLAYDPTNIFNFLHTQVGYNSYTGSVRGARGTLWGDAGNALDVASLGVALMRASGIPAQYVSGTLSYSQAQSLILSMFPASYQTVGYIPKGTATADPANDPQLLSETENHDWFQFNAGSGFKDADPLIAGATIGHAFTTATGTFAEVADALRARTEVQLVAEITNIADGLFGLSGQQDSTVLDRTFNDVDLVGKPLTLGNFVNSSEVGSVFSATTNTYSPYLIVGDDAYPDSSQDQLIHGTDYQEELTNFPLGSTILTGLFLKVNLTSDGGLMTSFEKTLADRIGLAARASGGSSSLDVTPSSPPLVSPLDLTTVSVSASSAVPSSVTAYAPDLADLEARYAAFQQQYSGTSLVGSPLAASLSQRATSLLSQIFIAVERSRIALFQSNSDAYTASIASNTRVRTYFDGPRITIIGSKAIVDATGNATFQLSTDLLQDDLRVVVAPGQDTAAAIAYRINRGFIDTGFEAAILGDATTGTGLTSGVGPQTIINLALQQGIALLTLTQQDLPALDALNFPADIKVLIGNSLSRGDVVIVPSQMVVINGQARLGWYQINTTTGFTIGELDDGSHGFVDNFTTYVLIPALQFEFGFFTGSLTVGFLSNVKKLLLAFGAGKLGGKAAAVLTLVQLFQKIQSVGSSLEIRLPAFGLGFILGISLGKNILLVDPPADGLLLGTTGSALPSPPSAVATVAESKEAAGGSASGSISTNFAQVEGPLSAGWSTSGSQSGFLVDALSSPSAVVLDANGNRVGTGGVSLTSPSADSAAVSGVVAYAVKGTGSLSFFGPAGTSLGVSGDWTSYSATVTGTVSITITTAGLTLDGMTLPAGTYTITTDAATLSGSGATSSPNFSGSASIGATGGVVYLGGGPGSLNVGGQPLGDGQGSTLDGYTGMVTVAADGNGTDSVSLGGQTINLLRVAPSSTTLSTDQNTPIRFTPVVSSSLADTYSIQALAPPGWTIAIDASGQVTVTPAAGTQSGTYPVEITVKSSTDGNLLARTILNVAVTPSKPGISFNVAPDAQFTVPYEGAQVPSAFRASIQNIGPAADTYNLTIANLPGGFTLADGGASVTVPAGQTGIVGLYLVPNPGTTLPAPGTILTFSITATSTTNPAITKTQVVTFTVPAIDAVTVTSNPSTVNTTPGLGATDTITITNVGNVAENGITFAATTSTGLTLTGLAPFSLGIGQSMAETLTIAAAASVPLDSLLQATITATYGASRLTRTLTLPVDVVVPGAMAIADASVAASQLGDLDLGNRLGDLSTAITNLVQNPTNAVFNGQSVGDVNAIALLVVNDAFLAPIASNLNADGVVLSKATTASTVQTALARLNTDLVAVDTTLNDEARHDFTLSLIVNSQVALPQAPRTFQVFLQDTGNATTTYDLAISGLPAGVTASFSQSSVTLGAGQSTTDPGRPALTVTLTSTPSNSVLAFTFVVAAAAVGADEIGRTTTGSLTTRAEVVSVVSVATNPPFTEPGGSVDVTARLLNAVNQSETAEVSFVVEDSSGTILYTSQPVATTLQVLTTLSTVDLGSFSTKGFVNGIDTIAVVVKAADGTPLPGVNATGSLQVGSPVTATESVTSDSLPINSGTVTNSVTLALDPNATAPLGLVGQVSPVGGASSVAIDGTIAYVGSTGGINIVDVSDPTRPTVVGNFGTSDFPANTTIFAKVSGNELVVESSLNHSNPTLLIYSLADPLHPALLGQTLVSTDFLLEGFVLSDNHAYFYSHWVRYYLASGTIFQQHGEIISVDISNPANPTPTGIVYNDPPDGGSGFPDGDSNVFNNLVVNSSTLLAGSTTATMGTLTGTGEVLVVDTSNPSAPALVNTLMVPGTTFIVALAPESGNRVLLVGSTGGYNADDSDVTFGPTGNLVLITLDIADPRNPKILSTQELARSSHASYGTNLVPLGGDKFLFSTLGTLPDQPAFFFVDASGPGQAAVTSLSTPTYSYQYDVSGHYLYTTSDSGLLIYKIGQPTAETPVTVDVQVPNNTGVSIVPGSFNVAPTAIIPGVAYDTIEWQLDLDQSTSTQTFTYKTQVAGLQAGVSLPVSLQAKVTFTSQGTPGSLTLAPLSVAGQQFIGIFPASETSVPGQPASYSLQLKNPTASDVTYVLAVQGVPASWTTLPATVLVPAGGENDFNFDVTSAATTSPGTYGFSVTASTADGTSGSASAALTIQGAPIEPDSKSHGIVATLISSLGAAGRGTQAHYMLRLTNTGGASDTFSLQLSPSLFADGLSSTFGQPTIEVPPGPSNFRDVPLTLTPGPGALPEIGAFTVLVQSTTDSAIMTTTVGVLDVLGNGVELSLNPASTAPGSPFELTVTNTGMVADTFDLGLFGPAALVSSLGESKITLQPGVSQVVPIATSAVDFAVQGGLSLTAVATSEGNNAVQAGATSSLAIPATVGMTAQLSPAVQVLPLPGTTSFLLIVRNTGNSEDSYTATLTGTNGPIRANLVGLDGLPTDAIPIFRVPGLSTAEIVVQADLLNVGDGQVGVRVRSLTDASMVSTQVATVSSTPATNIQLFPAQGPFTVGQPIAFTVLVTTGSLSIVPDGFVTLNVDGVAVATMPVIQVDSTAVANFSESLGAGVHQISASFTSAVDSPSSTSPIALTVNPATIPPVKVVSGTVLVVPPSPVPLGQPLSITAIVFPASGTTAPTGNVEFLVDGVAQPPVPLRAVAGATEAVLTLDSLSVGIHSFGAVYLGDANVAASASAASFVTVSTVVVLPPPVDGPRVTGIQRFGYHASPTSFVISFNGPLDPARAQDTANYRIVGPDGVVEPIRSAVYDPTSMTVTLDPAQRLDLHAIYQITIIGTGPSGLADPSGHLLDGAETGQAGSDHAGVLQASQLVLGSSVPGGPTQLAKLRRELAQIVANQSKQLAKEHPSAKKKAIARPKVAATPKVVHHPSRSSAKVVTKDRQRIEKGTSLALSRAQDGILTFLPTTDHRPAKVPHAGHPVGKHKAK